jgi:hypothetical protein
MQLVEAGLEWFDSCPILNNIPVIKTAYSVLKTARNVSDYIFREKLIAFLEGTKSYADVMTDFPDLFTNAKLQSRIGVNMLVIIDQTDSIDKATLIGKLFCECVMEEANIEEFYRLCKILEKVIYEDLVYLQKFEQRETIICSQNDLAPEHILDALFSSGLLANMGFDGGDTSDGPEGTRYTIYDYGEKIRIVMQKL